MLNSIVMKLTKEQVRHVARLARLGLTDAEVVKFEKELSGILEYVDILKEVNTEGVPPTAQVTGLQNVSRPDAIQILWDHDELLKCSPLPIERRQIKVKPVFE